LPNVPHRILILNSNSPCGGQTAEVLKSDFNIKITFVQAVAAEKAV